MRQTLQTLQEIKLKGHLSNYLTMAYTMFYTDIIAPESTPPVIDCSTWPSPVTHTFSVSPNETTILNYTMVIGGNYQKHNDIVTEYTNWQREAYKQLQLNNLENVVTFLEYALALRNACITEFPTDEDHIVYLERLRVTVSYYQMLYRKEQPAIPTGMLFPWELTPISASCNKMELATYQWIIKNPRIGPVKYYERIYYRDSGLRLDCRKFYRIARLLDIHPGAWDGRWWL